MTITGYRKGILKNPMNCNRGPSWLQGWFGRISQERTLSYRKPCWEVGREQTGDLQHKNSDVSRVPHLYIAFFSNLLKVLG